ncbi:hypothetical protein P5P86_12150 [Nocardioides sp. BP30]|uniref:S53 family peptidase n=1 Tax=Nocardioides sp. BP30 TaxID=3036374 RepID=UPI002468AF6C|nr:hypothetical protein [Nocardioides sp. BP30]WGL50715.1 hypothetical protein P5P86_12150 [Nocardioides sp. BP30]
MVAPTRIVFILPLAVLCAVVGLPAPAALADGLAPEPDAAAPNPAAQWTPPPEPALVPVPATTCPAHPAAGTATCLTEVHGHVGDATAADAGRSDAIGSTGTAQTPLPDTAVPQAVTKTGSYTPADLASLYRIPANVTSGATIGIVDVGSDPNTQAQLSYYRSYFGLPACTAASGCFREVGQSGSTKLPATDAGWVDEIAMDTQAVSAVCPSCHILLVDASSADSADLGTAAKTAVRLGATYLSLSYGSPDSSFDATLNLSYYNSVGVTYVAASGDSGYAGGTIFPSSATNVVAAGGTSARLVAGTWRQSAWSDAGSGCATAGVLGVVTQLVQSILSGSACPRGRAVTDVSALADPNTGLLFYRGGTWWSGGGTSLAAPIVASLYALAGNHTAPLSVYSNVTDRPGSFVDVTSGQTGSCGTVLCQAATGWDGPTGVGTPAGLAGLQATGATPLPLAAPTTASGLSRSGAGYPATLNYRLVDATTGAPVAGATALVEADTGSGFILLATRSTGPDGTLSYSARPHGPTSYRVVYGGDTAHGASTSPTVRVSSFAVHLTARAAGRRLRASATAPWRAAATQVPLVVARRTAGGWHTVAHARTNAHGKATIRVHRPGVYRVSFGGGSWRAGHTGSIRLR